MCARWVRRIALAAALIFSTAGYAVPIISAGSATVNVGDTFAIPISVSSASDLMAFQFDLSFNSSILNVVSFTDIATDFDAAATSGGGALTGISGFHLPGLLSGVADSISGAFSGLSGNGVIAEIEFNAIASGISPLALSNIFLNFVDSGFSAANGDVCVSAPRSSACAPAAVGGQVPEPGVLFLIAAGLVAITWRKQSARTR
jgi:hypothetical protein